MFIGLTLKRDNPLFRANSIHTPWYLSTTVVTQANNSGCAVNGVHRFVLLENWYLVFESYSEQDRKSIFVQCSCFHM